MKRSIAALAALTALTTPSFLAAQPAPAPPPPGGPPAPSPAPSPDGPPPYVPSGDIIIDDAALDAVTQTEGDALTRDVVAEALTPVEGGLGLEEVEKRSVTQSTEVALAQVELRAASARVDQAIAAYFPRVTLGASYTRVNPVAPFDVEGLPTGLDQQFPIIVNYWTLTASLDVPISDYLLRLTQGYAAAESDVRSKELAIQAEKLRIAADAKVLYFNWVRARGQAVVARIGFALSERHLEDARITLAAGLITEADVARLEAQLAQSKFLQDQTAAFARVADTQLKVALQIPREKNVEIGVDVMADPPELTLADLETLKRRALTKRLDYKAAEAQEEALEHAVDATRAGHYPRFNAFANGLYANPNQRFFPQQERWNFSWEVGVRLTWTVNDTFTTVGVAREREASVESARVRKEQVARAIEVEVTQAYYDAQIARSSVSAAEEREKAARMNLGIRRLQFRAGNATATDIVDSEAELIRAQLQRIDAHVDYLVAMARLAYAVGEPI